MTGRDQRDEDLGQALRALDVPAHGPEFFARLAQRLQEDADELRPTTLRPGRRPVWLRPPVLVGLAAAAVIVAIVAAGALFPKAGPGPLTTRPPDTRLISAAQVRSRVSTALASLRSLSGEVTIECAVFTGSCSPPGAGGRTTRRWSFVTTAAGDERVTGIGQPDDLAYSAARREQQELATSFGRTSFRDLTNVAPGPPDQSGGASVLRRDLASVVRSFLAATTDTPVTDVTEQGREAWRLVAPVTPNKLAGPGGSGDQLEVVVDRQTGFPLRITETLAGAFLDEIRLSGLVVDGPVDPASFALEVPAGVQVFRQDVGFRVVALGQVAAAVGYAPVLPTQTSLPAGYRLAEVTVAAQAGSSGNEGLNPPSRDVVSVAYRRGFDRIVVTTRSVGTGRPCSASPPGTDCWADPVASGEGNAIQPEPITVAGGALAGARAELVVAPRAVPNVWTIDSRLVVTISGDATADELRRLAESFAPAG